MINQNGFLRACVLLSLGALASRVACGQATATFSQATGVLVVTGGAADDQIKISVDGAGTILVNDGAIVPVGGVPNTTAATAIEVHGGPGNDVIELVDPDGFLPPAGLFGDDGNDLLIGGRAADTLRGGAGNDTLIGGRGNDAMFGEAGDDLMIWNNGDGSDLMEGGEGDDVAQVNGSNNAGDEFAITPNGARVLFQRTNFGLFTVDIGGTETLDVNGRGGDDVIVGADGLAALIALDLDGGDGDDELVGGDGADVLRGGAGNDVLVADRGNDVMLGEDGDDVMVWNNGDGSDLMEGGAGNDIARVNGSDGGGDEFTIEPNGGRVLFQRVNFGPFQIDVGSSETLDVNGLGGDDVMTGADGLAGLIALDLDGGAGNDRLVGGDGDDVLRGGEGSDLLIGDRGGDIMLGGQGNDVMVWNNGDGSDLMEGGGGQDIARVNGSDGGGDEFEITANGTRVLFERVNFGPFQIDIGTSEFLDVNGLGGDDTITGSAGLDGLLVLDLDGGAGNDLLIGGDGLDLLRGGDGNDTLIGGRGTDFMLGDDGDDLMIWNNGDGSDLMEGGAGDDVAQVNGSNGSGDEFTVAPNGHRVLFRRVNLGPFQLDIGTTETLDANGRGGDDRISGSAGLAGLIALDLDGGEGDDVLVGGDGDDVLRGGAGDDSLIGDIGNDTLLGGDGYDVIDGGNGDDLLEGGAGNDFLFGGVGDDTLFGGDDNDVLVGGFGFDTADGGAGWDFALFCEQVVNAH